MRAQYDPARDFVIYVGTTSTINTPEPRHRSRLLSVISMDLSKEYRTSDLIPPESWKWSQKEFSGRWMYAFSATKAWSIETLPSARDLTPSACSQLRMHQNFGSFVQLDPQEVIAILQLELVEIHLKKQAPVLKVEERTRFLNAPSDLRAEIYRWAALIEQRVVASNSPTSRWSPLREANPTIETQEMLYKKWVDQNECCGLCHRKIAMPKLSGLLQPSIDRIDSTNAAYRTENIHITHLGCNYAKSKYGIDDFEDWLEAVTGALDRETA